LSGLYCDAAVARFVTADTVVDGEYSVSGWNRYSYVSNNPVLYKDPTGHYAWSGSTDLDLTKPVDSQLDTKEKNVIFWSYKKEELNAYKISHGKVNWKKFEAENAFSVAAQTKKDELIINGYNDKNIIIKRLDNIKDLNHNWTKLENNGYNIKSLNIFSHGVFNGPEVAGGSEKFFDKPKKLKYTKDAKVVFHGCHTAGSAKIFAKQQEVETYGQEKYSSFSKSKKLKIPYNLRIKAIKPSKPLYLYDYEKEKASLIHINENGEGVKSNP